MYCSVSITRPEHYVQAILYEGLFEFESQNVSSVYPQQQQQQQQNKMAGKFTVGTPNTLEKVWNIDVITWLYSRVMRFQSRPTNWPLLTIESPVAQVVRASD